MVSDRFLDYADFVRAVIAALEAAKVDYMVGGSLALWAWGEVRLTLDLDVVIEIADSQLDEFSAELLKRGMALPPDILRERLADPRGDLAFQAIHGFSGYKADLFPVHPGDELRRSAFARRRQYDLGPEIGVLYVHAPEDLILYKLQYYAEGRQTKHVRDIGSILKHGTPLDWAYLDSWIDRLNLRAAWDEVRRAAGVA